MEDNKTKDQEPSWQQVMFGLGQLYINVHQKIYDFINTPEIKDGIIKVLEFTQKLALYTQQKKDQMKNMSLEGWFPSAATFLTHIEDGEDFDSYMERCIVGQLDEIEELLYEHHPERKIILEEAFRLFKEERYIAAIPLFISQLDGLSEDKNYSPFFSKDPKVDFKNLKHGDPRKIRAQSFPKVLKHALENSIEEIDPELLDFYSEVIVNAASTFIADRTPNVDLTDSKKVLNRNGIMHGHKDFVAYGTRINTLKVISLLLFVDHILGLIEKAKDEDVIE
ncbi:hypothetical protein [Acinetobacter sp. BMW17]|uniref:hypothetical protein n=1 Tax=Acinetobacter sp. BMW17 TaxID=1795629 RepID=UPI0007847005|nr:hypothetical protein [Acinetobacter sp. BMW17]